MEEEKARHTPGPWVYEYGAVYQVVQKGRLNKGRLLLADRDNDRTIPTERDANVRLCAAAPEMYAELDQIKALIELAQGQHVHWDMVLSDINTVLGKARGQL